MGKGDGRRPTFIGDRAFQNNWCRTFGHRMADTLDYCTNCRRSAMEIAADEHQGLVQDTTARGRRTRSPRSKTDASE